MIKFNVATINRCTESEGPFRRLIIWFQGCDIHCEGCGNPSFQAFEIKNLITLDELLAIIKEAKEQFDIEGVTYSGGEPTLQKFLPELTAKIHELGLGVISFTGHKYEEVAEILTGCDLVLDGSYEKNHPETQRRLLGSTNQRILCLSERYCKDLDWFYRPRQIEIHVGETIIANGDSF